MDRIEDIDDFPQFIPYMIISWLDEDNNETFAAGSIVDYHIRFDDSREFVISRTLLEEMMEIDGFMVEDESYIN